MKYCKVTYFFSRRAMDAWRRLRSSSQNQQEALLKLCSHFNLETMGEVDVKDLSPEFACVRLLERKDRAIKREVAAVGDMAVIVHFYVTRIIAKEIPKAKNWNLDSDLTKWHDVDGHFVNITDDKEKSV